MSLRAEGVAIPGKQNSKIKRQNDKAKFKNEEGFSALSLGFPGSDGAGCASQ
jgi:hypothetical protein